MTSQPSIPLRHSAPPRTVTIGARSFSSPDCSGHLPPIACGSSRTHCRAPLTGGLRDPRSFIPVILSSHLKISNYPVDDVAKRSEGKDVIRVHH